MHSDRGSQYASDAYQQVLNDHQLIGSMSGQGNGYDNAAMESFFHTLKVEAVHGERFETRDEVRLVIFEYIESYYNRVRRHSAIGYHAPMTYEELGQSA